MMCQAPSGVKVGLMNDVSTSNMSVLDRTRMMFGNPQTLEPQDQKKPDGGPPKAPYPISPDVPLPVAGLLLCAPTSTKLLVQLKELKEKIVEYEASFKHSKLYANYIASLVIFIVTLEQKNVSPGFVNQVNELKILATNVLFSIKTITHEESGTTQYFYKIDLEHFSALKKWMEKFAASLEDRCLKKSASERLNDSFCSEMFLVFTEARDNINSIRMRSEGVLENITVDVNKQNGRNYSIIEENMDRLTTNFAYQNNLQLSCLKVPIEMVIKRSRNLFKNRKVQKTITFPYIDFSKSIIKLTGAAMYASARNYHNEDSVFLFYDKEVFKKFRDATFELYSALDKECIPQTSEEIQCRNIMSAVDIIKWRLDNDFFDNSSYIEEELEPDEKELFLKYAKFSADNSVTIKRMPHLKSVYDSNKFRRLRANAEEIVSQKKHTWTEELQSSRLYFYIRSFYNHVLNYIVSSPYDEGFWRWAANMDEALEQYGKTAMVSSTLFGSRSTSINFRASHHEQVIQLISEYKKSVVDSKVKRGLKDTQIVNELGWNMDTLKSVMDGFRIQRYVRVETFMGKSEVMEGRPLPSDDVKVMTVKPNEVELPNKKDDANSPKINFKTIDDGFTAESQNDDLNLYNLNDDARHDPKSSRARPTLRSTKRKFVNVHNMDYSGEKLKVVVVIDLSDCSECLNDKLGKSLLAAKLN